MSGIEDALYGGGGRCFKSTFGAPVERDAIGTVRIRDLKAPDAPVRVVLGSNPSVSVGEVTDVEEDDGWLTFTMKVDATAWEACNGNPTYNIVAKADRTLRGISLSHPDRQDFVPSTIPTPDPDPREDPRP